MKCTIRGCNNEIFEPGKKVCNECYNEILHGGNPNSWAENCPHCPEKGCRLYMQIEDEACNNCFK